jgi:hypothetical protein
MVHIVTTGFKQLGHMPKTTVIHKRSAVGLANSQGHFLVTTKYQQVPKILSNAKTNQAKLATTHPAAWDILKSRDVRWNGD